MSEIKCSNENPTKLEKYLFKMYGLYPIYKHDDSRTYAPIHVDHDDTYPLSVEIDEEDIEWDEKIVFAISSGVVWLNSLMREVASSPFITGIRISIKTMSKVWALIFSIASTPVMVRVS